MCVRPTIIENGCDSKWHLHVLLPNDGKRCQGNKENGADAGRGIRNGEPIRKRVSWPIEDQ